MLPGRLPTLNSDVAESWLDRSVGDDDSIIPLLDKANVACGGHGGDLETITRAVELCAAHGVKLGAHISYKDVEGFGRRDLDVPAAQLRTDLMEQLRALRSAAGRVGLGVSYVKPHGALYNRAMVEAGLASTVGGVVSRFAADSGERVALMGLPGSALERAARILGLDFIREGFADRGYQADGTLTPRGQAGDLLESAADVAAAVRALAARPDIDTICVHSDLPGSLDRVRAAKAALDELAAAQ